jgi:hypothetical protein
MAGMRIRGWTWIAVCVVVSVRAPGGAAPPAPADAPLSSSQIAGVAALARAAALVRYLHPSDQAAALDWDAFLPAAIDRVLRAGDQAALLAELRAVFAPVAPTAVFSAAGDPPAPLPAAPGGTHLARWRRYGPGSPSRYPSFREGRDPRTRSPCPRSSPCRSPIPGGAAPPASTR